MPRPDLDAIRKRREMIVSYEYDGVSLSVGVFRHMRRADGVGMSHADACFIGNAPTDIDALLTYVEELETTMRKETP